MLLTLTTSHLPGHSPGQDWPATDLGYLLFKHPGRVQTRELPFGTVTVFYPEATPERTTAALLLEVDPLALSRSEQPREGRPLEPYVNDRPYAAGSFLAVALREVFGTAMTGRSPQRPELAETPIELLAELPCVAVRGPDGLAQRLFGPLGYHVQTVPIPLDPQFPEWGERPYVHLRLSGRVRLRELLTHLYVLLPVLDGRKHYYIGADEVDKLQRHGAGWLDAHPERELIAGRFLRFRELVRQATGAFPALDEEAAPVPGSCLPATRLHDERLDRVAALLRASGARRVLDLGCGEGRLLRRLLLDTQFRELTGLDISARALEIAAGQLHLKERPELRERVTLLHGSLAYPDSRLTGFGAAALVEVIEHLEPHRLDALTRNLFGHARPDTVIVTTPNREYNAVFEDAGRLRHPDHRFEWTRAEFQGWAQAAGQTYGYMVSFEGIGDEHPEYGAVTQVGVFEQKTSTSLEESRHTRNCGLG